MSGCNTLFTVVTGYPFFNLSHLIKTQIISFHTIQGCIEDSGGGGAASLFERGVLLYKWLNIALKKFICWLKARSRHPGPTLPPTCTCPCHKLLFFVHWWHLLHVFAILLFYFMVPQVKSCDKRVQTPGMSPPRAEAWTYCLFMLPNSRGSLYMTYPYF